MKEYKENEIYGTTQKDIFEKIRIPLDRSYGLSMRKYLNNPKQYDYIYFWFSHREGRSGDKIFYNILEENMIIMKKASPSLSNPRLWKNTAPKVVFYDDNRTYKDARFYKFKGVYQFDHSEKGDSKVYLKKIGSVLLIDEKTKAVSWK